MSARSAARQGAGRGAVAGQVLGWARRLLIAAVLVMGYLLYTRYGIDRVPPGCHDLGREAPPGSTLILARVRERTVLGLGTRVEAVEGNRRYFSQIAGVPGEEVRFVHEPDGPPRLLLDDRDTGVRLEPLRTPLPSGEIPPDTFLLLDPDRQPGSADSRRLGLVPRAAIRRKILAVLLP